MAVWTWPQDIGPSSVSFFLEHNSVGLVSPLSRAQQVLVRQGARWVCRMQFARRDAPRAARIDAFLSQLDGMGEEVSLFDFRRPTPRGAAAIGATQSAFSDATLFSDGTGLLDFLSSPVVSAATSAGATLVPSSGWQASMTVLLAGDYIGIGGRLYMVLDDATANGSGVCTLRIAPRLRVAAASGAEITFWYPTARFRLVDNAQGENGTEPGLFSSYSLSFVESLP